ncbi:MAG: hypothetical protein AAGF93_06535 [Cyanobacteria bacterium P01_H01_bin.105]
MKKVIVLSASMMVSTLFVGQPANADPVCYMVDTEGNTINLGHLCGETVQDSMPSSPNSVSPSVVTLPTDTNDSVTVAAEPVTIYTPELISEWMNGCMYEANADAVAGDVSAEMYNTIRSFCQCTIDTLQNTHTSQEFAAMLDSTSSGSMPPSLQNIVGDCERRTFG